MPPFDAVEATPVTAPVDLLVVQLRGLDLWHAARRATEQSAHMPGLGREARLDEVRELDVRQREHQAIIGRLALGLGKEAEAMSTAVPARAVIAHRHAWSGEKLAAELAERGIEVLCVLDNGADAVGVCVAEQPTVVVVDELLAMRTGCEVASEVRQFCPRTTVAGYVGHEDVVGKLLEAGAAVVFTRRVPPADVVDSLIALIST